jgi:DNA invertase Pin-like site-specific DNA recombinase
MIEMCRVVDTVLIDQETIYAPRHGNDRLLLGLKGSLNEYELDLLRQRSLSARYEKARRGELVVGIMVENRLDNLREAQIVIESWRRRYNRASQHPFVSAKQRGFSISRHERSDWQPKPRRSKPFISSAAPFCRRHRHALLPNARDRTAQARQRRCNAAHQLGLLHSSYCRKGAGGISSSVP